MVSKPTVGSNLPNNGKSDWNAYNISDFRRERENQPNRVQNKRKIQKIFDSTSIDFDLIFDDQDSLISGYIRLLFFSAEDQDLHTYNFSILKDIYKFNRLHRSGF